MANVIYCKAVSRVQVSDRLAAHMDDPEYNGLFHLVRISKDESVIRSVPIGIQSKWIRRATALSFDHSIRILGPLPSGAPDGERLGEDIVVQEPSVDRKGRHEEDDVSSTTACQ